MPPAFGQRMRCRVEDGSGPGSGEKVALRNRSAGGKDMVRPEIAAGDLGLQRAFARRGPAAVQETAGRRAEHAAVAATMAARFAPRRESPGRRKVARYVTASGKALRFLAAEMAF